jgi:voltage-gated potassium channel
LDFLLNPFSISQAIAVGPWILGAATGSFFYGLQSLHLLRIVRFAETLENRGYLEEVKGKILKLAMITLGLVFFAASIIYVFENPVSFPENSSAPSNMFDAFYMMIVTISTVGYGKQNIIINS